jgi:hypothetical protein
MIKLIFLPDGILAPVFICGHCDKPIQGENAGLITWMDLPRGPLTPVHKGRCDQALDLPMSIELEEFVDQLRHNTHTPFVGADALAAYGHTYRHPLAPTGRR